MMVSNSGTPFVFILLPIVAGTLMTWGALYFWRCGYKFPFDVMSSQATVAAKSQPPDTFWDYYDLTVQFTDTEGVTRTTVFRVQKEYAGNIHVGSLIPVTYPADKPENAVMGTIWGRWISGGLVLIFGAAGIGIAGFGLWLFIGRS